MFRHALHGSGKTRPLRVMYAAGPGNVIGTFRRWLEKREDPSEVAITYSEQFFNACAELSAEALVVASRHPPHPREEFSSGAIRVVHRRARWAYKSGLRYHFWQFWAGLQVITTALAFRADVVVVSDGTCPWFMLRALAWLGISVIPTVHCVFYAGDTPRDGIANRIIRRMDRAFWRKSAKCVLSISHDVTRQLKVISGGVHAPVFQFIPIYRKKGLEGTSVAPAERTPFRVLFAGRVERNKGVFELVEIASRLKAEGRAGIEFDLCGTGTAMEELRSRVREAGIENGFRLHGQCDRPTLVGMFSRSHVVIVPTTTEFIEGFNKVVAEGVLAGRPVITSSVCPAIDYVRDAVMVVPADDVNGYYDAILRLCNDTHLYERKRNECLRVQGQFYEPSSGWGAAFMRALMLATGSGEQAADSQVDYS